MTAFDPRSLSDEPLDTLLAATPVAGPDAAVDARLVAGLDRLTRRPPAPLPWAWIGLLVGLFAIAALWDLREPTPPRLDRETPWRYRPAVDAGLELRESRSDSRPSSDSFLSTP